MNNHGFLDEKGIIAIAFFVCIFFIIRFFGKNFLVFLDSKKDDINKNLNAIDNLELSLIRDFESLRSQEIQNQKKAELIKIEVLKQRDFILELAKNNIETLLNDGVENQNLLNSRFTKETKDKFSAIPIIIAQQSMTDFLLKEDNNHIQSAILDRFLDNCLKNDKN